MLSGKESVMDLNSNVYISAASALSITSGRLDEKPANLLHLEALPVVRGHSS